MKKKKKKKIIICIQEQCVSTQTEAPEWSNVWVGGLIWKIGNTQGILGSWCNVFLIGAWSNVSAYPVFVVVPNWIKGSSNFGSLAVWFVNCFAYTTMQLLRRVSWIYRTARPHNITWLWTRNLHITCAHVEIRSSWVYSLFIIRNTEDGTPRSGVLVYVIITVCLSVFGDIVLY